MERTFEKSLCLGTGIIFAALIFMISIPNAMILVTLYRNPLRCFRKTFTVFLAFITATDLFVGSVVCTGEAITRFLCSFRGKQFPGEGDIPTILGYIGINSSILMVTAMSVDRLVSVVCPHFYLNTVKPKTLVLCNSIIVIFSAIFACLQLAGIPIDVYISIDIHLHTTFPLITTSLSYLGIFFVLRKRARVDFQRREANSTNAHLGDMRAITRVKRERKFVTTSFLILLFLIISIIPYFASILVEANCSGCRGKKWLIVLRESSVVFLFLNSTVNPLLTTFRINELKHSLRIVIRVQRQEDVSSFGSSVQQKTKRNTASV
ncbi:unnamed protein product [Pocillopora meandrina]|uniref:G-protein coupled receptors family 1 profile domain-containing protein n=1 Tax=Pocillopora meandrina TaxID=46732 RepID=A0AAU9XUD9_9CNID|nr:unnamed protein product [Pocillopora meandrina]